MVVTNDLNRLIEIFQQCLFGLTSIAEFKIAVADVPGTTDLAADVVVQVSCQMKNQVADAVAVRVWTHPELLGR